MWPLSLSFSYRVLCPDWRCDGSRDSTTRTPTVVLDRIVLGGGGGTIRPRKVFNLCVGTTASLAPPGTGRRIPEMSSLNTPPPSFSPRPIHATLAGVSIPLSLNSPYPGSHTGRNVAVQQLKNSKPRCACSRSKRESRVSSRYGNCRLGGGTSSIHPTGSTTDEEEEFTSTAVYTWPAVHVLMWSWLAKDHRTAMTFPVMFAAPRLHKLRAIGLDS